MLRDNLIDKTKIVNGIIYSYDVGRSKWLSIGRFNVQYGINHRDISTSRWMAMAPGIYSNNVGFRMLHKGTITTVIIQTKNISFCNFIIRDLNSTDMLNLSLLEETSRLFETNLDFAETDVLKCYLDIEMNKVDFPFI